LGALRLTVGCTETLVTAPICEVTATEERHRLREIRLDAASEERRALLDKIKEQGEAGRKHSGSDNARGSNCIAAPSGEVFLEAERTFCFDPLAPPGER
jgi:hypothetical protein